MKKIKLMLKVLKTTNVDKLIYGFLIYILFMAFILLKIEPNITTYFDSIWYCFVTFSTVGFGDIVVTTLIGKILSIILMIYGMIIVAIMTGTLVNFYQEIQKIKTKDTVTELMGKLENLPNLSKKELEQISEIVKKRKYKI